MRQSPQPGLERASAEMRRHQLIDDLERIAHRTPGPAGSTLATGGGASRIPMLIAAKVVCGGFVRGWGVCKRRFGADFCKFSGTF